jgi:hypothetical protein
MLIVVMLSVIMLKGRDVILLTLKYSLLLMQVIIKCFPNKLAYFVSIVTLAAAALYVC